MHCGRLWRLPALSLALLVAVITLPQYAEADLPGYVPNTRMSQFIMTNKMQMKQIRFGSSADAGSFVHFICNVTWPDGFRLPLIALDKAVYLFGNLGGRFVNGTGPTYDDYLPSLGFDQTEAASIFGEVNLLVHPRWTYVANETSASFVVRDYRNGASDVFDCGALCTYPGIPGLESLTA